MIVVIFSRFWFRHQNATPNSEVLLVDIPVDIVSGEEMTFLEVTLVYMRPLLASSPCSLSFSSSSSVSRFALVSALPSFFSRSPAARSFVRLQSTSKRLEIEDPVPPRPPLLGRFRSRRGLYVTDITATEWCEKRMQFVLLHGKPKPTKAMEAGYDRHSQLKKEGKEVLEKLEFHIKSRSVEDSWAIRTIKFIDGAHQLLFEGLTRELPVVGVIKGVWMVGVIDEIRMPRVGDAVCSLLVDLKTRSKATVPSEAQKRNARLQLMCYKYLWDNLVTNNFPADQFFHHFVLNRQCTLSKDVKKFIGSFGIDVKTLDDVFTHFQATCCFLSPSHERLLVRYELQSDQSLLQNDRFPYHSRWFRRRINKCLKFWLGDREAGFVSKKEKWKCYYCSFASVCPRPATTASKEYIAGNMMFL